MTWRSGDWPDERGATEFGAYYILAIPFQTTASINALYLDEIVGF